MLGDQRRRVRIGLEPRWVRVLPGGPTAGHDVEPLGPDAVDECGATTSGARAGGGTPTAGRGCRVVGLGSVAGHRCSLAEMWPPDVTASVCAVKWNGSRTGRQAVPALVAAFVAAGCVGTTSQQVEVVATQPAARSTTTTAPPDCAQMLPPAAQAGQLLMVMTGSPTTVTEALRTGKVGGFGLKGAQSADIADQVATAIQDAPVDPIVAADEEGGLVQRLSAAIGTIPSASKVAGGTVAAARTLYGKHATAMKELGFTMNFAPVADVGPGSGLYSRSFGEDPATVSKFVTASVAAHLAAEVVPVVKHWPGIGGGTADPHLTTTRLAPLPALQAKDLVPFRAAFAAGAPAVMVAHARVPGLTEPGTPASLSRAAITGELRGKEKFDGLVITDSLGMGAIVATRQQSEAAEAAVAAGADVALLSGADAIGPAHERLTDAISSGRLPRAQVVASVRRVLRLKGIRGECIDIVTRFAAAQRTDCTDGSSRSATAATSDSSTGGTGGSSGNSADCQGDGTTGSDGTGTSGSGISGSGSSGSSGARDTGINDTGNG